jgi:hypothetical protein
MKPRDLSKEEKDLLSDVRSSIKETGTLDDELAKKLHETGSGPLSQEFRSHIINNILPNLSDEKFFNLTQAVMRVHSQGDGFLLRDRDRLSGDLYKAFAKRIGYSPADNAITLPEMIPLNNLVYKSIQKGKDIPDHKKATVTGIFFKLYAPDKNKIQKKETHGADLSKHLTTERKEEAQVDAKAALRDLSNYIESKAVEGGSDENKNNTNYIHGILPSLVSIHKEGSDLALKFADDPSQLIALTKLLILACKTAEDPKQAGSLKAEADKHKLTVGQKFMNLLYSLANKTYQAIYKNDKNITFFKPHSELGEHLTKLADTVKSPTPPTSPKRR